MRRRLHGIAVMATISLPHIYEPRDYQIPFFKALDSGKFRILVLNWHRRCGKDMTCWNAAIKITAEQPMSTKYGFPTNDMARANLWEAYTNDGLRFTDFVPLALRVKQHSTDDGLNDSLKRIELITGGSIRVISTHIPNRLRGGNDKLFVLSEFQNMDPGVIDIIEPILEANHGTLIINMTSNGDSAAKGMLEAWKNDPGVYVSVLTVDDTPVFTKEQMVRIRRRTIERFLARGQSEEEATAFVEQEYYCSWDSPVVGSYFGSGMRRAQEDGRIRNVPYEPQLKVNTYWDLGVDDSMSIWFVQLVGREVRVIDYYENSGEGMPHYINVLSGRKYAYDQHFAPHDIAVRELMTGVSRQDTASKLGINFNKVQRPAKKEDGIDAIRTLLPRVYFDQTKCKRGIDGLKGYKKKWNDKMMVYSNEPVHDWTSHPTDAFQTLALSNPEQQEEVQVYTPDWIQQAANQWNNDD